MSMLIIHKGNIKSDDIYCNVEIPLELGEEHTILWYKFSNDFLPFLSANVADAFVVAFLWYAMEHSMDIKTELPISQQLHHSLTTVFIPTLAKSIPQLNEINIHAELTDIHFEGNHSGTGISCGIDSLSTIIFHGLNELNNEYKIDTLTLLNTGYYGKNEDNSTGFQRYVKQSQEFCKENGYSFLSVDTNISNITNYVFLQTHTLLTNSTILLFQGYFKHYFYSSGYPIQNFKITYKDSAYYDLFILDNISTKSLSFHSGCCYHTRVEKTLMVLSYPKFQKYLYVCNGGGGGRCNCTQCEKCIRTTLTFESLNKRNKISDNFNEEIYKKNRIRYIAYMLRKKNSNIYYKEIYDSFKQHHVHIPISAHLCIIPCHFEINKMKSAFVKTRLGHFIYNKLH